MKPKPCVYIIHLDRPYKGTRHYVGWSQFLPARLRHHEAGTGARFLRAVKQAGIGFHVSAIYVGADRTFERRLHDTHSTADYCPCCTNHPRKFSPAGYVVTKPKVKAYKEFGVLRWQVANLYEDHLKAWQFHAVIDNSIPLVCARSLDESLPSYLL